MWSHESFINNWCSVPEHFCPHCERTQDIFGKSREVSGKERERKGRLGQLGACADQLWATCQDRELWLRLFAKLLKCIAYMHTYDLPAVLCAVYL